MSDDIGAYYERKEIERRAVARAFERVRALSGVSPTPDRLFGNDVQGRNRNGRHGRLKYMKTRINFSMEVAEYIGAAMADLVDGPGVGPDPTKGFGLAGSTLEFGPERLPTLTLRNADGSDVAQFTERSGWAWGRLYACDYCGREQWLDRPADGDECNCTVLPASADPDGWRE